VRLEKRLEVIEKEIKDLEKKEEISSK